MTKHITTVKIPQETCDRVNRLLAITNMEELTDEELRQQGANTLHNENIYKAVFDNGCSLTFNLLSDNYNYWDDVTWISANGKTSITIDSEYEIDDIEVDIESETYIVQIIKT